jgi:cell wall-associated NlpC family hydrolase
MRLLPDQAALGERWFGACRVSMAMTYREPRAGSFPQSQLLFGEPVFLLDRADGFLLLQAGDGYWGWVREEAIERMDRSTFRPFAGHRKAVFIEDARIEGVSLPRGASLPLVAKTEDHVTVLTPGGGRLSVPAGQVREVDLQAAMERRAEAALRMLHTPYVFGGRSPLGPDCSGIITNLCEQEGLPIARDAAQQVLSGKLVGTRWHRDDIRAGDRLYFLNGNGKVFHAGIALSPTHFVHAAPPEVQISSLRPGDRLYSDHWDRAFLAAKRP